MLRIADTDVLGATLDANAERMLFGSPEQPGQTPARPKILQVPGGSALGRKF